MSGTRRIAVMTGGGDCPGLNAVLRAVVKTAIIQGIQVVGIEDGFLGLVEDRMRPLGWDEVSNILTLGGTILGSTNRCDPSRVVVETPAGREYHNRIDDCLAHLARRGIDTMVVIGGDGTMDGAANFVKRGIRCLGVPKTIDNDIWGTDTAFGFLTAAHVAAEALDRVHTTAASHHRAMVVEVMGRNAGWIALHAGLAAGADVILIPEIPYQLNKIGDIVRERSAHGRHSTLICVAEGAVPVGGTTTVARLVPASPDPVRLGGIGMVVADEIEKLTGVETRCTVLGYVQRGGTPVPGDRVLATELGHAAVEALLNGVSNRMLAIKAGKIDSVDLLEVAGRQRRVPLDHPLMHAARGLGTRFGD